ncbi:MAG: serine/threonine-protein kinase [Pseudomonadota bacterium]|nr:serine/threonine-protein kinase [Pseudomonadota bacterium]
MDANRRELEFLKTLGSGGFGAVYLANLHGRDRFVRRVAVKVMREGLDATPDLVARQKDEARLLGLLAHDGIVQVLDLTEVDGRPAVVMEYVEGVDLSDLIKSLSPRRVPGRAALEIIAGVAAALDAAYNTNSALTDQPLRVIHRDIKPANILVTVHGRVKVLDFGVAKADFARDGHTTNGGWGTPRFMSPEQWLGETYGAAVDIYALGVTLFDLVADRPWERPPLARTPFEGKVSDQLNAQTDLPDAILELIERMTRFEAADRPTAGEVHDAAETAAGLLGGDNLARFARVEVPPLVEARSRSNANKPLPKPLPGPVLLGGVSTTGGGGTAEPTHEPSIVPDTYAPTPSAPPAVPEDFRAVAGFAVAGVLAIIALGVVGLGLLGWRLSGGLTPGALVPDDPAAITLGEASAPPQAASAAAPAAVVPERPSEGTDGSAAAAPILPAHETTARKPADPRRAATPKVAPEKAMPETSPAPEEKAQSTATAPVVAFPLDIVTGAIGDSVWLDGTWLGTSPILGRSFPAGPHSVAISRGDARTEPYVLTLGTNGPSRILYSPTESKWRTAK